MRALVFADQLRLVDVPRPSPLRGESLVRVTLAGICNTDVEITKGYADFHGIIGHEFVGIAESGPLAGQRVVAEINIACGQCALCRSNNQSHCLQRKVVGIRQRDGVMAEYVVLPDENLHAVPVSVPDRQAVFVEPLAAALEILEGAHIRPSETVVVIGDGKLGQLVAQVLALTGCDLTLVGRHQDKLDVAGHHGIAVCKENEAQRLRGADVVVDCTGSTSGLTLAASLVRARGRIVLKSTFHGAQSVAMTPLVVDEVTLIGSRCGPFPAALRLLQRNLVDVEALISDCLPLSLGVQAFEQAQFNGVLKVLLKPDALN
jgi:alcohol dehydrogenase